MATASTSEVELYNPGDHEYSITTDADFMVALVGETGCGKTSFINALLRNKTGVSTPTSKPQSYNLPRYSDIELWDLPGLGTKMYGDINTYYKKLKLENQYDAFLLFTNAELRKPTKRLAKRLECIKKPILFIRTFLDEDAKNEKYAKGENFDKEKMKKEIHKNFCEELTIKEKDVFLISNVCPDDWDFDSLVKAIVRFSSRTQSVGCIPRTSARVKLSVIWQSLIEKWEDSSVDGEKWDKYVKEQSAKIKSTLGNFGIETAMKTLEEQVDSWTKVEIKLAVVGRSGTGKSSFINSIRGIKPREPGAAKVGVTDTTMEPRSYPYKDNSKITLWDFPGFGTDTYADDAKIFCDKVDLTEYNAFIIVDCDRFTTGSKILAEKLKKIKKPFFLVRTKIDRDISNQKYDEGSNFDETASLKKIRANCFEKLNKNCVRTPKVAIEDVFLISNHIPHKWDFGRLTTEVKNHLSSRERECFLYSMKNLSEDILKEKVKTLKDRVKFVSFFQSMIVKFLSWKSYWEDNNNELIKKKVDFYQSQLGFPKEASEEFTKMPIERQEAIQKFYLKSKPTTKDVEEYLKKFDPGESGADETEILPFWGDTEDYKFVSRSLHHLLDEMEKVGLEILKDAIAQAQVKLDDMNVD